jgi:hypothetical protein
MLLTALGAGLVIVGAALVVAAFFKPPPLGVNARAHGAGLAFDLPPGVAVIAIGVFVLLLPLFTSATSPPKTSAPTGPAPHVTFDSPADGAAVSRRRGFTARGTATALGRYTIWLLDYDGGYTVDDEAAVSDGKWTATDAPLGDETSRIPFTLEVRIVLADAACAGALAKLNATRDDYTAALPPGCAVVGSRTVTVSKP